MGRLFSVECQIWLNIWQTKPVRRKKWIIFHLEKWKPRGTVYMAQFLKVKYRTAFPILCIPRAVEPMGLIPFSSLVVRNLNGYCGQSFIFFLWTVFFFFFSVLKELEEGTVDILLCLISFFFFFLDNRSLDWYRAC